MRTYFFLLLFVSISLDICAQDDVSTAKWMRQPVIIDGENTEWGALNFYDDQTQLNFGIGNDSNNIYLCFQTTTEPSQMKLMRAGMKVTLSSKKDKHEASIEFPLPQQKQMHAPDSIRDDSDNFRRQIFNKETFRQNFIARHSTMQVNGFATINGVVSVNDSLIKTAINWDSSSNFIYEIAIAREEFFGTNYQLKDAMNDITLRVEVNGLPKSELSSEGRNNPVHNSMQAGQGEGGSGMHGGGMRGGGRHGGGFNQDKFGGQQNQLNGSSVPSLGSKASFKQKFVLSAGK